MDDVQLSVVIASHNTEDVIDVCLSALAQQADTVTLEVIVADSSTDRTAAIVKEQFGWVRLLHFDPSLTVPALRGRAIAAARGAIIAVLDPFSVADRDWASEVVAAHARRTHAVIGGTVDLYCADSASYAQWSLYLNEYGLFTSPVVRGETWILPGSNLSYKRAALFDGARPRYPVFWKTYVNWEIEGEGSPLWLEPGIRVELNKPIPFFDFLRSRYHHGRCFAGMRTHRASRGQRLARTGSAVVVPLLLLWRWTAGFWPKRRLRLRYVSTIPAQLLLFVMWSWGEAWGYLRGTGRSCEQIYY